MGKYITSSETKILQSIAEDFSKEECIRIWNECREGVRKKVPNGFWQKHNHRKYVFFAFLEEFQRNNTNRYPGVRDYRQNKLRGFIEIYDCSPLAILKGMGFTDPKSEHYDRSLAENPYLVIDMPRNYWSSERNRVEATKWLVDRLNKPPSEIRKEDFESNGLTRLLILHNGSPYSALKEAGYDLEPTDMHQVPCGDGGWWSKKENRARAIIHLMAKLDKLPEELSNLDFLQNNLVGLLDRYGYSAYKALIDSGFDVSEEDRAKATSGYWKLQENRVRRIQELAQNLGRLPNYSDIAEYAGGALNYKKASELLEEAGL